MRSRRLGNNFSLFSPPGRDHPPTPRNPNPTHPPSKAREQSHSLAHHPASHRHQPFIRLLSACSIFIREIWIGVCGLLVIAFHYYAKGARLWWTPAGRGEEENAGAMVTLLLQFDINRSWARLLRNHHWPR